MGHRTCFDLTWRLCDLNTGELTTLPRIFIEPLSARLCELSGYLKTDNWWGEFTEEGTYIDYVSWCDFNEDLLQLSSEYPNIYFQVTGVGEDSDDRWVAYYVNGKKSGGQAKIVYPSFDFQEYMGNE